MKNWISEHVFLVDAVVYFLFTLYLCINYLAGRNSWTDAPFWCFFVIIVYLHVLKRAKKQYTVNSLGFWIIILPVMALFSRIVIGMGVGVGMNTIEKNSLFSFLFIFHFWKFTLFMAIQQLLNYRNYVNGIEVKKYDFWSQDERKKKEQEKRESKEREENKTEENTGLEQEEK